MALYIVTGSPGCGKSTWVRNTAKPGDIRFGGDELTNTLTGKTEAKHHHDNTTAKIARAAREAGIREAIKHRHQIDIYLLISNLSRDEELNYRRLGAKFIVIDPGYDIALQRCRDHRPGYKHRLVDAWYNRRDEWPKDATIITGSTPSGDEGEDEPEDEEAQEVAPQVVLPRRGGKPTNQERGYDRRHRMARRRLIARMTDGEPCWWCGLPMHEDKAKNWDELSLAADHVEENGARNNQLAERLLHFRCNSQRQDGRNDHLRPALTGKHPSEPLVTKEEEPAKPGFTWA